MKERSDIDSKYLGTVFDRQVRIEDWNQQLLGKQTILCIGAGGLGSIVILNLLRLGVKKIIIVDYDNVDLHNLNRQLMYTLADVGKRKVESCIKNAVFHNVGNTQLEGFDGCALTNWQKIIGFVKEADFIFNMIDYGDWYDAAIQSLCFKLKKCFIMGGTFALSMTMDFLSSQGKPCYWCLTGELGSRDSEMIKKILPQNIQSHESLKFLPKNNNPTGRSSVCICTVCGEFMIAAYLNNLFFEKNYKSQRVLFYPSTFESVVFPLEPQKGCPLCGSKQQETKKQPQVQQEEKKETQAKVEAEPKIQTTQVQQPKVQVEVKKE